MVAIEVTRAGHLPALVETTRTAIPVEGRVRDYLVAAVQQQIGIMVAVEICHLHVRLAGNSCRKSSSPARPPPGSVSPGTSSAVISPPAATRPAAACAWCAPVAIGLIASLVLARSLESVLYGVKPTGAIDDRRRRSAGGAPVRIAQPEHSGECGVQSLDYAV